MNRYSLKLSFLHSILHLASGLYTLFMDGLQNESTICSYEHTKYLRQEQEQILCIEIIMTNLFGSCCVYITTDFMYENIN